MLTPRELVDGKNNIEIASINNRVCLILALDSYDQRIGIQIDQATRDAAKTWQSTIDFNQTAANFSSEVLEVTNGYINVLPTEGGANTHFTKSLRCAYSGGYEGSWVVPETNESMGFVGLMIQADGYVVVMGDGQTVNTQENTLVYVTGNHDVNEQAFIFDTAGISGAFYFNRSDKLLHEFASDSLSGNGISHSYSQISGTFSNGTQEGNYQLKRADALSNAAYRYTGFGRNSLNETLGMIIFDIDPSGKVEGMIHDIRDPLAQPRLSGFANYDTNEIEIMIESNPIAVLRGTIDFDNTSINPQIEWYPDTVTSQTIGYVDLVGCQLQAID